MMILSIASIHVDDTINVSRGGRPITDNDVSDLAMDIKEHGLLEEVGVIRIHHASWLTEEQIEELVAAGKSWLLIYGFRRLKACQLIGFRDVKVAEVGTDVTLAQAELANVAENWGRRQPTDYDLMMACARFVNVHKTPVTEIALRTQKTIKYVEESVHIVKRVDPLLLQHYRANCSRDVRRKMLELANIDGVSDYERHQKQNAHWEALESAAAQERRTDPNAGFNPKRPKVESKKYQRLFDATSDAVEAYLSGEKRRLERAMRRLEEMVKQ